MTISRVERRRPPPQAVDERASVGGLRAVATFEAVKGLIVLLLGLGILGLLHKDVEVAAENLLMHLHINPDRRLSHAFINAASRMTDAGLWMIFSASLAYAGVRFTEAWGYGTGVSVRIAVGRVISAVGDLQTGGASELVAFERVPAKYRDPSLYPHIRIVAYRDLSGEETEDLAREGPF